ncbi:MAG TPA: hypothetical protein VGK74_11850 [Symbiobacteriaceae bacterium]|jgi:hypothetical protein
MMRYESAVIALCLLLASSIMPAAAQAVSPSGSGCPNGVVIPQGVNQPCSPSEPPDPDYCKRDDGIPWQFVNDQFVQCPADQQPYIDPVNATHAMVLSCWAHPRDLESKERSW